jgi:PIN domain nuclease of toxin-antitoxin system
MRLLVDAHAVVWAVDEPSKLSPPAITALQDPANDLIISAAQFGRSALRLGSRSCRCRCPSNSG